MNKREEKTEGNIDLQETDKDIPYTSCNYLFNDNPDLSATAKHILLYFISRPKKWTFRMDHLEQCSAEGSDALQTAMKQLERFGYLKRERKMGKKGHFEWHYKVFQRPIEPWPGGPAMGDRALYYKDNKIIERQEDSFPSSKKKNHEQSSTASCLAGYLFEASGLLEIWNDMGDPLPRTQIKNTKAFHSAMQSLQTKLIKGLKFEEIESAMIRYRELITARGTNLNRSFPGHLVNLSEFFGFNNFTKGRIAADNLVYGIKSWFDECMKGEKYLADKYGSGEPDDFPAITKKIREEWEKSPYSNGEPTFRDERNFIVCAEKLVEWLNHNESKINLDDGYFEYPQRMVNKYLFGAIKNSLNGDDPKIVTTQWLASDNMFGRRLHLYLVKLGLMKGGSGEARRDNE